MSEPARISADLPRGFYEISSLAATGNPLIGIGHHLSGFNHVHVNATNHIWEIKPEQHSRFGDAFRLSLQSPFPYTGVENNRVIVTKEVSKDLLWYIWDMEDGTYTIASAPFWPSSSWTLASEETNAEIAIRLWHIEPDRTQLFKIRRLLD